MPGRNDHRYRRRDKLGPSARSVPYGNGGCWILGPLAGAREVGKDSRVVLPPSGPGGGVVVPRSLAETPVLLSLRGESSCLSVLVDGVGDPVDSGVSSDGLVRWAGGLAEGVRDSVKLDCLVTHSTRMTS